MTLSRDGEVTGVMWDGPAFQAGLAVGGRVIAVNGVTYEASRLTDAIAAAKTGAPVELLIRSGDRFRTVTLNYRGGLRYPRLERIPGAPPLLDAIFAPRR